ncbi:8-amino-7-oxononanoate synthase [Chitiniphilus shinanonensis]|uniref:8-amino-7-oxononanoate synthase n=1 Tax=Chitiniphilus shinanonensis TaxID=553088 RepID=A0ABQ6C0K0_9NEIS|nr:8-amino-7-oxononanoate synthase [Chitiniphilus shinanonensis]GLS05514.1 8-amino-7-oxononanoate synthase [Chitiniphilus shinanonensis]
MPTFMHHLPAMPFDSLAAELAARRDADLYRRRRVLDSPAGALAHSGGRTLLNFSSNDYLGLARDATLIEAAQAGAARWGVGAGASHLVTGHGAAHQAFEDEFAAFVGKPAALSLASGYQANLAAICALVGREDAVFADKLNHASLNDACLLSRAEFKRYPHNDPTTLERLLAGSRARRRLIVVDGVFSMDGDLAPLRELLALAECHDAWLYVDDAHGFGVLGDGRGSAAGLVSPRLIYMATLGKAAGVGGAAIAAEAVVIDYLVNFARPYIYTTATPPLLAETLRCSLRRIAEDGWRRERLVQHIRRLRAALADSGLRLLESATPIQPLLAPDSATALRWSAALAEQGLLVAAIRPPTVPSARLRITLSAAHLPEHLGTLIAALRRLES